MQKGRAGLLPRPGTLSPSALLSCWTSPAHVYDAFGNRIERLAWDGATTTHERFVQDGWANDKPVAVGNENFDTILDLDGSNALVTRRVTGDGFDDLIARISSAGTVGWYITDRQGSVQSILDNSGNIVAAYTYDGFGQVTYSTGSTDRYQYTAREFDSALGLMYYRARMYDRATGRFFGLDQHSFSAGDANLYRYVGNSPTNGTDPSGNYIIVRGGRTVEEQ